MNGDKPGIVEMNRKGKSLKERNNQKRKWNEWVYIRDR